VNWYLDTNICIYFLKGLFPSIAPQLAKHHSDQIKIPSMVKAELLYGAEKSMKREENLHNIYSFLRPMEIVPFGDSAAAVYADLRASLELEGNVIGPNDLIIAATALAGNGILVTHNTKEYCRIPDLRIEDWTLVN
jgi:tRNA(fMet)-specific endonuclease VapC